MIVIGLTGGIGSGKTTVANLFSQQFNTPIIDADLIAYRLTQTQGPALEAIRQTFGAEYIIDDLPSCQLNRAQLRARVVEDPDALKQLEQLLHPLIEQQYYQEFAQLCHTQAPYILFVAPLLLESERWKSKAHKILVIDCCESVQIERATQRKDWTQQQVQAIIIQQISRAQRLQAADFILENNESLEKLPDKIKILHRRFLALSHHQLLCNDPIKWHNKSE